MKFRVSLIFSLPLLLVSCAPKNIPMARNDRQALKQQPAIHIIQYKTPNLVAMTPGKAMLGGIFGGAGTGLSYSLAESAGENLSKKNALPDPTQLVQQGFINDPLIAIDIPGRKPAQTQDNDRIEIIQKKLGAGILFDFKTINWALVYYRSTWSRYRILLTVRARVINLKNGRMIWQGICKADEDEPEDQRHTMDQLLENDAAIFREKISQAGLKCAKQLVDQYTKSY